MIPFVANAQLRNLPDEFLEWINSKGMNHATVSLEVAKITSPDALPEIIYSYDNQRSVQPASTMKLLTTATALSKLDNNAKIKTEVYYSGSIVNGVLNGDLIIKGYGNAMLSSSRSNFPKDAFANSISMSLRKEGITRIDGNIIGDGTLLTQSPIPSEWTWEDMGNHYAQSISGLNYEDNAYEIVLNTAKKGTKPTVVKIEPNVDDIEIDNQLLSIDYAFDSAYVFGAPYQNKRTILGAVPHHLPQYKVKGDVPDPAQFAASRVKTQLEGYGILISGKALSNKNRIDYSSKHLLYTHYSESIAFLAKQTNVFSINLMAEMLLRQLSWKYGDGSETDGINVIQRFLQESSLDIDGIRIFDGCGLAPADRVTTDFIVNLLNKMKSNDNFVNSLAIAGKTGTVYSFLKNTRLEGKAKLKTGTTKAVIAYSGYVEGSDGHTYAISFIVNNHSAKSAIVRKNIEKMFLLLIP